MKRIVPLLLPALLLASTASAQERRDLTPLLRNEAPIRVMEPGLHRIPLSEEVLRDASADLSDVRIVNRFGDEVPWLLAGTVTPRPATEQSPLVPLEATQERRRFVYDRFANYETFVLALPPAPVGTDGWDLSIDTAASDFTRRYHIAERDGAAGERGSGTLFRFTRPLREKRRIPLAARGGTFVITLEGDDHRYLSPTFTAVAARPPASAPTIEVPLSILSERSDGGVTTLRVRRPRGVIPTALRFETSTGVFARPVIVRDDGFGSSTPRLGRGVLHRITSPIDDEALEVGLAPGRGDAFTISITDEDGPPLRDLRVVAVLRQPVLVADLEGDAILRFGGGRVRAPRYDLSRLAGSELGRALVEAALPTATLESPRPNPAFDDAPALSWAMRPGAEVERFRFRYRRAVFVDPSDEGLCRIRATAADLGVLAPDLGDLRIVDTAGHQWPYLAEPNASLDTLTFAPETQAVREGTAHTVVIESGPVPVRALRVDAAERFFDRDFVLYGRVGDEEAERELGRGRLSRRPDRDPAMRIEVGEVRVDRLRLVVRDGADAPLTAVQLSVEVPVPDFYVAAPPGDYTMLLGAEGVAPPHYEIARARDLILAVTPSEAYPRSLEPNPDHVPPRAPLHLEDFFLWLALLLAVLILTLLTLRALRAEPSPEPEAEEPASPEGEPESA